MGAMGAAVGAAALAKVDRARAAPVSAPRPEARCLLRGTNIQTTTGERKVEELAWRFAADGVRRRSPHPVDRALSIQEERFLAALGEDGIAGSGRPLGHRTRRSGPHALLIDGLLIPVGNLINDTTIRCHDVYEDELEFFHIKMESHDAIYAEGAPVETLLGVDEGAINFAEYFRLYGVADTEETLCAPRVSYGGVRGEFKSRIRSAISPWVDRREQIDVIRDRLEERGIALTRELEPSI